MSTANQTDLQILRRWLMSRHFTYNNIKKDEQAKTICREIEVILAKIKELSDGK